MPCAHQALGFQRELAEEIAQVCRALSGDVKRGEGQVIEHRRDDTGLMEREHRWRDVVGAVGLAGATIADRNEMGPDPAAASPVIHPLDHLAAGRPAEPLPGAVMSDTVPAVPDRAFPVIYAQDVARTVAFYERLGFEERFRLPPDGEAGYVGLCRRDAELAVVTADSPRQLLGVEVGERPRFELFIYVDDVDQSVRQLQASGATVLRHPEDMFWGERVAYVADPEGNPVALAAPQAS